MASQFKNRLVGVTILVALVVIFLPSIIDGKKTSYQQEFVTTPIKPELKEHSKQFETILPITENKVELEKPAAMEVAKPVKTTKPVKATEWKVEEIAEEVTVDNESAKPNKASVKTTSVAPSDKKEVTKLAWTIQLGAFQNKTNINSLLKKLNANGFQVHTLPKEVIDGHLTRVFVGPDVSKKVLAKQLPRLRKLTNLKGKLVPYNPTE